LRKILNKDRSAIVEKCKDLQQQPSAIVQKCRISR
jgi:hypothetical protein